MQASSPSSSSLNIQTPGFDTLTPMVFDVPETPSVSTEQVPSQTPLPIDQTPTLADLGRLGPSCLTPTGPATSISTPQAFKPSFERPNETRYHQQIHNDEALGAIIHEGMKNFITLYDTYHPTISKGLAEEGLLLCIERKMVAQEKVITDAIHKLQCPIKKFQAEYRLAILTEDEEVYHTLIDTFFRTLFAKQNTPERLQLLKLLAEPSPRPLSIDFELLRLNAFLQILNNPELPFEYEEKRTLVDAHMDLAASCLALRLNHPNVSSLWQQWVSLSKVYKKLDIDFECRTPLPLGTLHQKLSLAFATFYNHLSRGSSHFPLYATVLGTLVNDTDLMQEALATLKSTPTSEASILPLNVLSLLLYMYADNDNPECHIAIIALLVTLILTIIDRPADYCNRWQNLKKLGLILVDISKSRQDPACLEILCALLRDNEADLKYKRSVYAYLRSKKMNQAEAIETFNAQELHVREELKQHIRLGRQFIATKIKDRSLNNSVAN